MLRGVVPTDPLWPYIVHEIQVPICDVPEWVSLWFPLME